AAGEKGAILVLEARRLDRAEHVRLLEAGRDLRQQAFADGEAREVRGLDDQHLEAAPGKEPGRQRAGRAGADHGDVDIVFHGFLCSCRLIPSRSSFAPRTFWQTNSSSSASGSPATTGEAIMRTAGVSLPSSRLNVTSVVTADTQTASQVARRRRLSSMNSM